MDLFNLMNCKHILSYIMCVIILPGMHHHVKFYCKPIKCRPNKSVHGKAVTWLIAFELKTKTTLWINYSLADETSWVAIPTK